MTSEALHKQPGSQFRHKISRLRPKESDSARAILKSMLLPDEKILHVAKISNGIYWKSIAVLIFSVLFLLIVTTKFTLMLYQRVVMWLPLSTRLPT